MVSTTSLLDQAVLFTKDWLRAFAEGDDFLNVLEESFGDRFNLEKAEALRQVWTAGDFTQLPAIQIESGSVLQRVNGAYAAQSNKIFLSQDFVEVNLGKPEAIASVLLEEIGHFVDAQINSVDSSGDEGAIFSALVRGKSLITEQLTFLQAEDDTFTLADGTQIEAAATLIVDTLVDENDGNFSAGDLSLREAIALATPGDTIAFANSGTITLTQGELKIDKAITINGDIDGNKTPDITISGSSSTRVFNVDNESVSNTIAVRISSLRITEGSSKAGAGILNRENLVLTNSTLDSNQSLWGGAIYNGFGFPDDPFHIRNSSSVVSIINSTINSNYNYFTSRIYGRGSAIYNNRYGNVIISNSTFSGNSSYEIFSGGPFVTPEFKNSVIFNNYNGTLDISSSTLYRNNTELDIDNLGTATLKNSIIGGSNFGGFREGKAFYGNAPTLIGTNLIEDRSIDSTNTNGVINGDPRLGLLQNNGGSTFTHQLLTGSPAINAGDNTVAQDTLDIDNDGDISEPLPLDQRL